MIYRSRTSHLDLVPPNSYIKFKKLLLKIAYMVLHRAHLSDRQKTVHALQSQWPNSGGIEMWKLAYDVRAGEITAMPGTNAASLSNSYDKYCARRQRHNHLLWKYLAQNVIYHTHHHNHHPPTLHPPPTATTKPPHSTPPQQQQPPHTTPQLCATAVRAVVDFEWWSNVDPTNSTFKILIGILFFPYLLFWTPHDVYDYHNGEASASVELLSVGQSV